MSGRVPRCAGHDDLALVFLLVCTCPVERDVPLRYLAAACRGHTDYLG